MVFDAIHIAGLRLRNRIVRTATYEKRADADGRVTDELIEYYRELAYGGAGLIVTGGAVVHPQGRALRAMLALNEDSYIEGLTRLVNAVHGEEGVLALQLTHGGRQCSPRMLGGLEPLAPSEVFNAASSATPRAMQDAEIWDEIEAFARAAFRARTAGFDAIELDVSRGYLLQSFLSPLFNLREDYWGGDEERRWHAVEETLRAVRREVGEDYPLFVKLSIDEHLSGGYGFSEVGAVMMRMQEAGVDMITITGGSRESEPADIRREAHRPWYAEACGELKRRVPSLRLCLSGGFTSLQDMEGILHSGIADLAGLSRPLICEPDLPLKLQQDSTYVPQCTRCNECLRFSRMRRIYCRSTKEGKASIHEY